MNMKAKMIGLFLLIAGVQFAYASKCAAAARNKKTHAWKY